MKHPLPRGWQKIYFNNDEYLKIIDGDRGINYPKQNEFFNNGYCVFLNTKNVTKYGFNFDDVKYINKGKDEKLRSGKLKKYDIVMTTRGTIGNIAFYDDKVYFENVRINSGMVIFRVLSNNIFNKYLYMFLSSSIMKKQISNYLSGMAQPQLPISSIYKLYFLLPPLDEQKRIADILSTFDDLIENLKKLIEKKELYKKGVMQRVLTGKVRFNGFKDEWETVKLKDILIAGSKDRVPDTSKYKKITIKLHNKGIEFSNIERKMADKRPFYIRKKDEIIIGKQNYFNGSIAIVDEEFDNTICSNAIMSFTVNKNCNNKFIYFLLSRKSYMQKYYHLANGTGQKELSESDFLNFNLLIPSLEEQNKIAELLTLIDKDIDNLKQLLHLRKLQKKGVMQKLLTGEVRI